MKLPPELKQKLAQTVRAFLAAHERDMDSAQYRGLDATAAKKRFLAAVVSEAKLWAAIPLVLRKRLDRMAAHGIYETLKIGCPAEIGRIYAAAANDPEYLRRTQLFWQYLRPRGGEDFIAEEDEGDGPDPTVEDIYEPGAPRYASSAVEGVEPVNDIIPAESRGQVFKSNIPKEGEEVIYTRSKEWLPSETTGERSEFEFPENEAAPQPRVDNVPEDLEAEEDSELEDDEHLG